MAFSFGFYNSLNGDRRYNTLQISMIFDGIIRDGIYATVGKSFMVRASEEENTVIVQPGRAWFDHTWNYNDADLPIVSDQSELLTDRIDALVIDIKSDEVNRKNDIIWVKGVPGSAPVRPTLINEGLHHQYPLCYIYRKANTEIINQEDITNMVGTEECPFVTGILQTLTVDDLLLQWKGQWYKFITDYEEEMATWTEQQKTDFNNFYSEFKIQMLEFQMSFEKEVNDWFKEVQAILDGDVAGNLLNAITEIDEREFNHYYGLVNSNTVIDQSNEDGWKTIITTKTDEGTSVTKQSGDFSNNRYYMETTITMNTGNFDYRKTVQIIKANIENEKRTTINTTYVKIPKEV